MGGLTGTETVLLVEDEPSIRQLMRRMLESHGYTLLEARNGDEALSLAEEYTTPIHLLLTDVVMPKMDGFQLAIRLTQLYTETRVLFLSGHAGMSRALLKLSGSLVHDYATISDDSPSPNRASRARRAATSAGIS